jgi:hypothetical protein
MTRWTDLPLETAHAELLEKQGILPETVGRLGIRSARSVSELPEGFENFYDIGAHSIVFPWKLPDGTFMHQIKLSAADVERVEDGAKYLWPKGNAAPVGEFRKTEGATKILIVEGTKQSIVASQYAPSDFDVYGIPGCWSWSQEGTISEQFHVVDGKEVYIILDADASSNRKVYDAGVRFAAALGTEGAEKVFFVRMPASGSTGLDDFLATRAHERRAGMLTRMLNGFDKNAVKFTKPADRIPDNKRKVVESDDPASAMRAVAPMNGAKLDDNSKRVYIDVNQDQADLLDQVNSVIRGRWGKRKIFRYGDDIARVIPETGEVIPQTRDLWQKTLIRACSFIAYDPKTGLISPTEPNSYLVNTTRADVEGYLPLRGVKHAPFVRKDGTVCQDQGYDEQSGLFLVKTSQGNFFVPERPSAADIAGSRAILEDWLYDFLQIMPTDSDRANVLALIMTPYVRHNLPTAPLAVINGLQMGVGKNLLADGISIVYNGEQAAPQSVPLEEEEQRKQLTSTFISGKDFVVFDEAHVLAGKPLAQALTAATWSDRTLGKSVQGNYPNQMTWISLGNNVRVEGDIARRVYQVRLKPNSPNPENRRSSEFRHPDFREYTRQNRHKILTAILTLIRAWYAAGSPAPARGTSFGSFETWEKTMGGILETAGISGFLDNQDEFRSESSTEMVFWTNHLMWLEETFGDKKFTTRDVYQKLRDARGQGEAPPNMENIEDPSYTRKLGIAYSRVRDRYMNGYRLIQGEKKRNIVQWYVETPDTDFNGKGPDTDGDNGGGGTPPQAPTGFGSGPVVKVGPTGEDAAPFNEDVKDVPVDQIDVFGLLSSTVLPAPQVDAPSEFITEDDMDEDFDPFAPMDNETETEYTESMTTVDEDDCKVCDDATEFCDACEARGADEQHEDDCRCAVCMDYGPQGPSLFEDEELCGDNCTCAACGALGPFDFGPGVTMNSTGQFIQETIENHSTPIEDSEPEPTYEKNAGVFDPVEVKDVESLVFDIETASADDMWTEGYEGDFVRLSGFQADDDEPVTTAHADALVEQLTRADEIIGHNIIGFDLMALAKNEGAPYSELADKAIDTLLVARQIDPPSAQGMPNGYYSLDKLAERLGVDGKTDDLKGLAKEFGGFDKIPVDDARYVSYLEGDLNASRQVYDKVREAYHSDPYIKREHQVQSRMAQVTIEGFRVDVEELDRRLEEQAERKAGNLKRLSSDYGVPLEKVKTFKTKDPVVTPVKSPLATREGKDAVINALKDAGATIYPKTEKSGDLSTNKDRMNAMLEFYKDPEKMVKYNIDPDSVDVERIEDIVTLVTSVTGERTVYQTIKDNLAPDGRVHPRIFPDQASGRWSVTKPGLTVLGKRGGKHYERGVLIADEGCVLRTYDLDQVDARAIAAHSKDPEYLKNFEPGMDLHTNNAIMAFGRADGEWRDRAKILGHGFNYGLGPQGAADQTGMPLEVAQQFHEAMKERYWVMEDWKNHIRRVGGDGDLLDNGFGRKMRCNPDRAYTQAPALVGQGATRDIIAEGILRLPQWLVPCIRAVIHDEIVFNIPVDRVDEAHEEIMNAMQFRFLDTIDITSGASKTGTRWSELYEK